MANWNDVKNAARTALDFVAGEGEADRLKFSRYAGKDITSAIMTGKNVLSVQPREAVILAVNPEEISYTRAKLITKIPTSAPERFIVQDWGADLTVMGIAGNTGNLLPGVVTSGGNPLSGTMTDLVNKIKPDAGALIPSEGTVVLGALANTVLMNSLTYNELLALSPKYRTFKKLEAMYDNFDSNDDILILEIGDDTLRGYFLDFSFTQTANDPWNWKYTMSFVQLVNLTKLLEMYKDNIPSKSTDGSTAIEDA